MGFSDASGASIVSSASSFSLPSGRSEPGSGSVCSCVSGYYPSGGQCVREVDAGLSCNSTIQCTENAQCELGSKCLEH